MRLAPVIAAAALLSGCGLWYDAFDRPRAAVIDPLPRVAGCGGAVDEPQIHFFNGPAGVDQWLQAKSLPPSGIDAKMEGPFLLIEPGKPSPEGDSLLVSREAILHSGARLALSSTIYQAASASTGPSCALLALPPQHYEAIELYDQEGALRARITVREVDNP